MVLASRWSALDEGVPLAEFAQGGYNEGMRSHWPLALALITGAVSTFSIPLDAAERKTPPGSLTRLPEIDFENFRIEQDTSNLRFTHFITPFDAIYDIKADKNHIWFAQMRGVMRYDTESNRWSIFSKSDGLEYDELNRIGVTSQTIYAIAVYNRKVANRYDKTSGKWDVVAYDSLPQIDFSASNDKVDAAIKAKGKELVHRANGEAAVLETPADIWFGGEGVCSYRKSSQTWNCWRTWDPAESAVTSIVRMRDGLLWYGTRSGIIALNEPQKSWRRITTLDGLQDNPVLSMTNDGNKVVVVHNDSISIHDIRSGNWERRKGIPGGEHALLQDEFLWLGNRNGLRIYKLKDWSQLPIPEPVQSLEVLSIISHEEHIWVGTNDGLFSYKTSDGRWEEWALADKKLHPIGPPSPRQDQPDGLRFPGGQAMRIQCMASHDSAIILGLSTWARGAIDSLVVNHLVVFDPTTGSISPLVPDDIFARTRAEHIAIHGDSIWVANGFGLYRIDKRSKLVSSIERAPAMFPNVFAERNDNLANAPISILKSIGSALWIGTGRGIGIFDAGSGWRSFYPSGYGVGGALNIQAWGGRIWTHPVYVFAQVAYPWAVLDKKTGRWRYYHYWGDWRPKRDSLIVKDDTLWFGDEKGIGGINLKTGALRLLPSNLPITGVLLDGGIWGITEKDLRLWNAKEKKWRVHGYDSSKLVRGFNPYNSSGISMAKQDDFLWIGNGRGIARFDIKTETFEYLNELVESEPIIGIIPDGRYTWMVGSNGRVFLLDATHLDEVQYMRLPSSYVAYVADGGEDIACATGNMGIVFLNKNRKSQRQLTKVDWASISGTGAVAIVDKEIWIGDWGTLYRIPYGRLGDNTTETPIEWKPLKRHGVNQDRRKAQRNRTLKLSFSEPMEYAQAVIGTTPVNGKKRKTIEYPGEIWEFELDPGIEAVLLQEKRITVKAADLAGNPLTDRMDVGRDANGNWTIGDTGPVELDVH